MTRDQENTPPDFSGRETASRFRIWLGFSAMCIGMFMAVLDVQVVASSLTNIGSSLKLDPRQLGWIQTSYLVAEIIAIPMSGWLTRALSLRYLFSAATLGFVLASIGCAGSTTEISLITARIVQGFFGGMLIPAVFTSIYSIFPRDRQLLATTIGGSLAMIAPTIGPVLGGYLTQSISWHWIFLINVMPGLAVSCAVFMWVRSDTPNISLLRKIDYVSIVMGIVFLAGLEILLKEAPSRNWHGELVSCLLAISGASGAVTIYLCSTKEMALVNLTHFRNHHFRISSILSFTMGVGLYGSIYVMALFLGAVRGHSPLQIGLIMAVAGVAQLLFAPVAAFASARIDSRWVAAAGFALFATGLLANGFLTVHSDMWDLFWPQILRGSSLLLCLLPITQLAMERQSKDDVADASAVFNLMRNMGGAIGIAVIDTIVQQQTPGHAENLKAQLMAGNDNVLKIAGLSQGEYSHLLQGSDYHAIAYAIQRAALTQSLNEAWLFMAAAVLLSAAITLPFWRTTLRAGNSALPAPVLRFAQRAASH